MSFFSFFGKIQMKLSVKGYGMKAVLFDLDGTLLDTLEDLAEATNYSLEKLGFPRRSVKEIRAMVGNGVVRLLTEALPKDKKDAICEILPIYNAYYANHAAIKTRPFEGILPMLDRLKEEGYGLAVISNKPDYAVQTLVKKYFPAIEFAVGEREGIRRKPFTDSIEEAIRLIGADRSEVLFVGDSEVDVETAKNARIPCVAMTWGFRDRDELIHCGAEKLADTANELYELIHKLIG